MFSMILKRMEWMDEKGIQQWNAAKYDTIYPLSYYEEKRLNGEVFVLVSKDTKELISAAVLKEQDDRWNDSEPALYLHNFVTCGSSRRRKYLSPVRRGIRLKEGKEISPSGLGSGQPFSCPLLHLSGLCARRNVYRRRL